MINAISAADIAFITSSSKSTWLLSPLSVLLRNKTAERFASVSEDELCEKCIIIILNQLLHSVFAWYHELSKPRSVYRLRQITQTSVLIIHDIMLNLIQWLQLKYIFRLEENVSHAMDQNSLTPQGNNNMNFWLARDQVVLLETAANLWASRHKANDFFTVFL